MAGHPATDDYIVSLVPRPHPLFNVARRKRGEPGSRSHVHDIYVEGWWKGDYFAWAGDLFAGALYITIASYIFMRNHLKFYSAPTGSRPTIADLFLLPCESRSLHVTLRTRLSPFSACNIEAI